MMMFEYKVVPAPAKGTKAKGVKTPHGRFAVSIEQLLNDMAADGWEFQRAELLPSEERAGLTGSTTNWRNVMVFRRPVTPAAGQETGTGAFAPQPFAEPKHQPEPVPLTATAGDPEASPDAVPVPGPGAREMMADDGVEELSPVSGVTAALKTRAKQQSDDDS
ncbi:DUF4177 domain-containing protein [Parasedimentitalea maritima]|uniref:DUF4177 domain-containing protein n=1 Tax=Parasedimentitalea maritima TaxID=2578117 RepID=A0A6A4RGJ3_9RHOB|nr:DUF4177 domain-containing protein [Zongyanglinia marina]KAE9629782.1 DUF4177 domain-containing protein [Zongyanglinia marina]